MFKKIFRAGHSGKPLAFTEAVFEVIGQHKRLGTRVFRINGPTDRKDTRFRCSGRRNVFFSGPDVPSGRKRFKVHVGKNRGEPTPNRNYITVSHYARLTPRL